MYHIYWACFCSLSYPAYLAHAPYCHLWPTPLCILFLHYRMKGTIFFLRRGGTLLSIKCVFPFSLQILSETFFILRRSETDVIKKSIVFMYSICCYSDILMQVEFSWQFFKKILKSQIYENPSSGSRIVPRGRTAGLMDRHVEANSCFSQFCKCD